MWRACGMYSNVSAVHPLIWSLVAHKFNQINSMQPSITPPCETSDIRFMQPMVSCHVILFYIYFSNINM